MRRAPQPLEHFVPPPLPSSPPSNASLPHLNASLLLPYCLAAVRVLTELLGAVHEAREDVGRDGLRRVPDAQGDDLGVRVRLQEGRPPPRNLREQVAAASWMGRGGVG